MRKLKRLAANPSKLPYKEAELVLTRQTALLGAALVVALLLLGGGVLMMVFAKW